MIQSTKSLVRPPVFISICTAILAPVGIHFNRPFLEYLAAAARGRGDGRAGPEKGFGSCWGCPEEISSVGWLSVTAQNSQWNCGYCVAKGVEAPIFHPSDLWFLTGKTRVKRCTLCSWNCDRFYQLGDMPWRNLLRGFTLFHSLIANPNRDDYPKWSDIHILWEGSEGLKSSTGSE
jgi:hypothetical protein